jgi:hypothetical protein
MHPDLVNLHAIDGDIVDMKYFVIVRNTTVGMISPVCLMSVGHRHVSSSKRFCGVL